MPIAVSCPECSKSYRVPDQAAGRRMKCKACGAAIAIPQPADDDESFLDELEASDLSMGAALPPATRGPRSVPTGGRPKPGRKPTKKAGRSGTGKRGSSSSGMSPVTKRALIGGVTAVLAFVVPLIVKAVREAANKRVPVAEWEQVDLGLDGVSIKMPGPVVEKEIAGPDSQTFTAKTHDGRVRGFLAWVEPYGEMGGQPILLTKELIEQTQPQIMAMVRSRLRAKDGSVVSVSPVRAFGDYHGFQYVSQIRIDDKPIIFTTRLIGYPEGLINVQFFAVKPEPGEASEFFDTLVMPPLSQFEGREDFMRPDGAGAPEAAGTQETNSPPEAGDSAVASNEPSPSPAVNSFPDRAAPSEASSRTPEPKKERVTSGGGAGTGGDWHDMTIHDTGIVVSFPARPQDTNVDLPGRPHELTVAYGDGTYSSRFTPVSEEKVARKVPRSVAEEAYEALVTTIKTVVDNSEGDLQSRFGPLEPIGVSWRFECEYQLPGNLLAPGRACRLFGAVTPAGVMTLRYVTTGKPAPSLDSVRTGDVDRFFASLELPET